MNGRLLTVQELAVRLGVSRRWVYSQVENNGLPAYRLGRALRFDEAAVDSWLARKRTGEWESCADTPGVVELP